jgi:ABC-type phosphate/phosphonate transport system substrate-binding protein
MILKLLKNIVIFTFSAIILTGCFSNTVSPNTKDSEIEEINPNVTKEVIYFAASLIEDPTRTAEAFYPICEYLSENTNYTVEYLPYPTEKAMFDDMVNGNIDIAILAPSKYIKLKKQDKVTLLAKMNEFGKENTSVDIFTNKDKSIETISDLKDKKLIAIKKFPLTLLLEEENIKEEDLQELKIVTSMEEVLYGVQTGDFDAGLTKTTVFLSKENNGLQSLLRKEFPSFTFVSKKGLREGISEEIKQYILELNDASLLKGLGKSYTGFSIAKDSDYDWLRSVMK